MKRLMTTLMGILAIYLVLGALLRLGRHQLVFFPSRPLWPTPQALGVPHDDVTLTTEDGVRLQAWLLHAEKPRATVLFFHGNAGNIGDRLQNGIELTRLGLEVLLVDYRGYGKSEGTPTEEGTYRDATAACEYLARRPSPPPGGLVIFGRSLGAAVAVELATRKPCRALVIESAFTSVKDLARGMFPYNLFLPMIPAMYESLVRIRQISVPTLVIHGSRDEIIPFEHGKALHEACRGPRSFHALEGATHNDWYQSNPVAYFKRWSTFLQEHAILPPD